jgi:hypothetical protein
MEGLPMFRFTIRELLILTVTAGLAVGWWMERRANTTEGAQDAKLLARYTAPYWLLYGEEAVMVRRLQEKYEAKPRWPDPPGFSFTTNR